MCMHVRTDRLRTRDPTESETRVGWRCKLRLKLHRSTPGVRPLGALHTPTTTDVSSTRLDSEHSGARLLSFLLAPPNTTFNTPTREFSARSARGARPRSFDHSDRDASSPPTQMCFAWDARGPGDYLFFSYKITISHSCADTHDAGSASMSAPSLQPI